jgi:serine/threonine protein kinase
MTISLKKYGIDFEGSVSDASPAAIPVMKMVAHEDQILWTQGLGRYFSEGVVAGGGGYGDLLKVSVYEKHGNRLRHLGDLYEKRSRGQGSLLTEACLQVLAYQELEQHGMQHMVAEVQDILRTPRSISFTMKQFDNVVDFHSALGLITDLIGPAFDIWFLQLFVQVVVVLGLLEGAGINHRDMKGDNILISTVNRQVGKLVTLSGQQFSITYMNEVYIVDFGFSCKGDATGAASMSAGPFFGLNDVCPKDGRDNYILMCYFYAQPTFRQYASGRLLEFVRSYLAVPKVIEHLERFGMTRTEYIYLLLNNKEFRSSHCSSVDLLAAIAARWPAIVSAA